MSTFPKKLYVKIEKDGSTEYFSADAKAALLVEMGEKIKIAEYQLIGIHYAEGIAQISKGTR